jgi:hypothetical protein
VFVFALPYGTTAPPDDKEYFNNLKFLLGETTVSEFEVGYVVLRILL